jgi:hypothetical protein
MDTLCQCIIIPAAAAAVATTAAAATATDTSVLCVALYCAVLLQVPTTEDEKEDFGDYDREGGGNLARKYIDDTRRRKGLWVEEKLVEKADKQRNRSVRK